MNAGPLPADNFSKRSHIVLAILVLAGLALAWYDHFIMDDAFISFTYARNLVEGNGLTWFGVKVEGYTNFLWVLWIALGMKLGMDPITWSYAGGLASFVVVIIAVWKTSSLLSDGLVLPAAAVLMLISNYTMLSFATSGLETMLQAALISLAVYLFILIATDRAKGTGSYAILSIVMAAAFLVRMDSAVPIAVIGGFLLYIMLERRLPLKYYAAAALPFGIVAAAWLAFRYSYYGRLFPNPYYAKVASNTHLFGNGFLYVFRFLHWYLIWPLIALGGLALAIKRRRPERLLVFMLALAAAWCAYVVYVGGDFMEFRFMVPVAPVLFVLVAYLSYKGIGGLFSGKPVIGAAAAVLVLAGASLHEARTFTYTPNRELDSISQLATFYGVYADDRDWGRVGNAMKEQLGRTGAEIAVGAAGAIPYYSGLRSIDIWGLNDLEVPIHGNKSPALYPRPGHRCLAKLDYLMKENVNLVMEFPVVMPRQVLDTIPPDELANIIVSIYFDDLDENPGMNDLDIVAMPLDGQNYLVMWYLSPSPEIDNVIAQNRWFRKRLRRRA